MEDLGEVLIVLTLLSTDEDWVRGLMERIDQDGDGNISLQEFVEMNIK